MRQAAIALGLLLLAVAALASRDGIPSARPLNGMPVAMLGEGKPQPRIGLLAPLPKWIPLPEKGLVTGAGLYPPQPPFGPAAVVMLRYDESQDAFVAGYRHRLERAGFTVRRIPVLFHLIVDRPDAAYEADGKSGGPVAYIVLRHAPLGRFAQLTFYAAPGPRMHL